MENQVFNAIDTVFVEASVSDDNKISSIKIYLIDNLFEPTGQSESITANNTEEQTVKHYFSINDIHLFSGIYYLEVEASDGINTSREYVKILIDEIPIELRKIIIVCSGSQVTDIYASDTSLLFSKMKTLQQELSGFAISSYNREIAVLTNIGSLQVFYPSDFSMLWTVSYPHLSGYPFSGKVYAIDNYIYAGFTKGNIYGYDANGVVRKNYKINSHSHTPGVFYKHTDYMFIADVPAQPIQAKIEKLNFASGGFIDDYETNIDIVEFTYYDDNYIMIWGNENNTAKVCTLHVVNNVMYSIDVFPDEQLVDTEQIDDNSWIFITEDNIYNFYKNSGTVSLYLSLPGCSVVKYEELTEKLYIASNTSLFIYDYKTKTLLNTKVFPDNIIDCGFLYNK
ncbi:MAG: hypothetical protein Kow0068_22000 [Marinilabiliales bacterium]